MTEEWEGFRDRIVGGCPDCPAYIEVVKPQGSTTSVTIFHDATCPALKVRNEVKPDVMPDWPEQ